MNCSKNGLIYEKTVFNIVKRVSINNKRFNNQSINDLGNCSSKNDIICLYKNQSFGIEIKKFNTPDWMQCSINLDNNTNKWIGTDRCKIPKQNKNMFNKLLNRIKLFDGHIPPFIKHNLTHKQWIKIKKSTTIWNDQYIDIPNDTILKMYQTKDCKYIQISNYGLYHLGYDICKFNVPAFIIDQRIRIRIKVHKRKDSNSFCRLSIAAACQPKNIKELKKSKYSLDDKDKLPINCNYNIYFK